MLAIIPAITALFQLLPLLLKYFMKTPEEKMLEAKQKVIDFLNEANNAISKAEKKPGDTKDLEDVFNKRLP